MLEIIENKSWDQLMREVLSQPSSCRPIDLDLEIFDSTFGLIFDWILDSTLSAIS